MEVPKFLSRLAYKLTRSISAERVAFRLGVKVLAPSLRQSVEILSQRKPFLITSTGRTGTTWLAGLLSHIPDLCVVHEPVPWEQVDHLAAVVDPNYAYEHLIRFRLRDMAYRARLSRCSVYGEVNGPLRRNVQALRELVPAFRTIHLVRNGRDVVTSIMNRGSFTGSMPGERGFRPPDRDIPSDQWDALDRFSKIAWMWTYENTYLRENCQYQANFEDILSSYSAFRAQILDPLDLELDEHIWESKTKRVVNPTSNRKFDRGDWTRKQQESFERFCTEEMHQYGYE